MSRDPGPVFVQRRTYRIRRLTDAARLLPVLGIILFSIPLLWRGQPEEPARTASVMLYLFVVWVLLAGLAAVISRRLEPEDDSGPKPEGS